MMTDRSAFHWNRLVDHINPGRWEVQQYIDAIGNKLGDRLPADTTLLAGKMLSRMVQQQSRVVTFADVFVVLAAVFLPASVARRFARKPKAPPPGPGERKGG